MILDPAAKPLEPTHNSDEIVQFWNSMEETVKLSDDKCKEESKVNSALVTYLKMATDSYKEFIRIDQDLYRMALTLTESNLFKLQKKFCLSKLLSLLNIDLLEMNMKFLISYILLCESKKNIHSLEIMIDFQGFNVFYNNLYTEFAYLNKYGEDKGFTQEQLTNPALNELNDIDAEIVDEMHQISTVLMDLLFQIFKFCKCNITALQLIDDFFVYFMMSSMRSDVTTDLFNNAQFKLILVLNEQYMMFARKYEIENKIFKYLINGTISKKFTELLLLTFNRSEDVSIKIMMCKVLYLILTTTEDGIAMNFFYLNDLHVFVDVMLRELQDISENEEVLRNTFLRVLLPLLKNTELSKTQYRRADIVKLLRYLTDFDNICTDGTVLHEHKNTVTLAFKCLTQVDWLSYTPSEEDPDLPASRASSISIVGMSLTEAESKPKPNSHNYSNNEYLTLPIDGHLRVNKSFSVSAESLGTRKAKPPPPPPPARKAISQSRNNVTSYIMGIRPN